jgi:hypothetical protein
MNTKRLGIWMDHSSARLMDDTTGVIETTTIESLFTYEEKGDSLDKSENLMHHKEQHEQAAYFKQLADVIKNYDDVLLFGATQAKAELYNILKGDHHFEKIRIEVRPSDRLTVNQQEAFVRTYFARSL